MKLVVLCKSCGKPLEIDIRNDNTSITLSVYRCVTCKDACYNRGYQEGLNKRTPERPRC